MPIAIIGHLLQIKWTKLRENKIFPIKMKINGCSLIYIEAEKVGGIKAVSVENWWGIWKRQRKSADTQIHKYKSQTHKYKSQKHKYEDQLMIDEEFGRGRERVQIHKYTNTNHKYTNMKIKAVSVDDWWGIWKMQRKWRRCISCLNAYLHIFESLLLSNTKTTDGSAMSVHWTKNAKCLIKHPELINGAAAL